MDEQEKLPVTENVTDETNNNESTAAKEPKTEYKRLDYLDNIKWITVLLVVVYHIFYLFNCSGVISNIGIRGIPYFDAFLDFVNPWFMCLMFVVSGVSARYALAVRTPKEFIKDRLKRILLPSVAGIFLLGWITGWVTSQHGDMFGGNAAAVPSPIKYLIFCFAGLGPLWYCHVLFVGSLLLALLKKIDKKRTLEKLGAKVNILVLFLMVIPVWLSSMILNVPVVEVYRFGIYLFMMLLGYYVFSNKKLIASLGENAISLIVIATVVGVLYAMKYYGYNYAKASVLRAMFTNIYLWVMIIAIMGFAGRYLNKTSKFGEYMKKNSYYFYLIHYPLLVAIAHFETAYLKIPMLFDYIVIAAALAVLLPLTVEILKRIPIIKTLVFGTEKKLR